VILRQRRGKKTKLGVEEQSAEKGPGPLKNQKNDIVLGNVREPDLSLRHSRNCLEKPPDNVIIKSSKLKEKKSKTLVQLDKGANTAPRR